MSMQNPVFIPGPTNIAEASRKACYMPTPDHRPSAFARLYRPAMERAEGQRNAAAGARALRPDLQRA